MPKSGTHENKEERKEKYRVWLLAHEAYYRLWPRDSDRIRKEIVAAMRADGVVAKTTGWRDVRLQPILDKLCGVNRDGV